MIGRRKPTAELVVAPRNAITVLILVSRSDKAILTTTITRVTMIFIVLESFLPHISSMESLVGSTVNGVAKSTTRQIPKREI